jgi:hypothetical protein
MKLKRRLVIRGALSSLALGDAYSRGRFAQLFSSIPLDSIGLPWEGLLDSLYHHVGVRHHRNAGIPSSLAIHQWILQEVIACYASSTFSS